MGKSVIVYFEKCFFCFVLLFVIFHCWAIYENKSLNMKLEEVSYWGQENFFYAGVQCTQERNVIRRRYEFCSRWIVLLCTASGLLFSSTISSITEAATGGVLYKKVFLKLLQNSQENTCVSVSACNFIIKETLAQVFSYEFCKILKNIFFTEHHLATACAISF